MNHSAHTSNNESIAENANNIYIQRIETDPFIPAQVETYLSSLSEWRNVQDIIRICFKSLTDTVRNQGLALREMDKALRSKISRPELNGALSLKLDTNEYLQKISQISIELAQKATNDQVKALNQDKVTKNELMFYVNNHPSNEEFAEHLSDKLSIEDYKTQTEEIIQKFQMFQSDVYKRLNNYALHKDLVNVTKLLDTKANVIDVTNALDVKADKENVYEWLQQKSDKNEIQTLLDNKIDKNDFVEVTKTLEEKADKEQIEETLKDTIGRYNIEEILKNKADVGDFKLISEAFTEMKSSLNKKIDDIDNDFDRLIDNIKTQFQSINVVINNLENNKCDKTNFDSFKNSMNKKADMDKLDANINKLRSQIFGTMNQFKTEMINFNKAFEEKINGKINALNDDNQALINNVNIQNDTIRNFLQQRDEEKLKYQQKNEELIKNYKEKSEESINNIKTNVNNFNEQVLEQLKSKADVLKLQEIYETFEMKLQEQSQNFSENLSDNIEISKQNMINLIDSRINNLNEQITDYIKQNLNSKISSTDLNMLLQTKVDYKQLDGKLDVSTFNSFLSSLDTINNSLKQKLDVSKFANMVQTFNKNFENIRNDISTKAEINEILSLIKSKADQDDFNKSIKRLEAALAAKNSQEDFIQAMDNQAIINDTLCNENSLGRWLWKGSKVKAGFAIPWESQTVNTAPDNFIWEKDRTFLTVSEGGLYEINMAFYCNKRPNVQCTVNGEVIISAGGVSGKVKNVGKTSFGNVTGLSVIDFVMLPDNAKISVAYTGEEGCGFIGLKKL